MVDLDYADVSLEHEPPAETPLKKTSSVPTLRVERSRLGLVFALVGAGLLLQGAADGLARSGHLSHAIPVFLAGISLQFAACAWRLLGAAAARTERIWVSLALGVGLFASYVMLQPFCWTASTNSPTWAPWFVYSIAIPCSPPTTSCR